MQNLPFAIYNLPVQRHAIIAHLELHGVKVTMKSISLAYTVRPKVMSGGD